MDISQIPDFQLPKTISTLDELSKQLAEDVRWRARMAEDLKASTSIQRAMEEAQASIRSMQRIVPDSLTRMLDQQQKLWRDAMGPLEQLRASSFSKSLLDDALGKSSFKSIMDEHAKSLSLAHEGIGASMRGAFDGIGAVTKDIFASLDSARLSDLSIAAQPFASIKSLLDQNNSGMRSVMDEVAKSLDWSKSLRLPVIDYSAAAAVARIWGEEGLLRQVRALGVDRATIDELIRRSAEEAVGEEDHAVAEASGIARPAPKPLSLMDWFSILSVLLAILVPIWQKIDSDATEAHLASEIKDAAARNVKRIEALARLIESMVERGAKGADQTFVARSRVALIRRRGESGSAVQAEVFPNQVVKVVSERGKWIQVEYFDWLAREEKVGWALKKYFVRVPSTEP